MSLPGYMTIVSSTQGEIEGECTVEQHEKTTLIYSCSHSVQLPTDKFGLSNGRRLHMPLTIVKEVDRCSPMLYQALSKGEIFDRITIQWFRIDSTGLEELYFVQTLEDAQVISVTFDANAFSGGGVSQSGHLETVSFVYKDISWVHSLSGIEFNDTCSDDQQ